MKIKYWLMFSYFIVMLLPIIGFYVLYVSLTSLDKQRDIQEHFEMMNSIKELEDLLEEPSLYHYEKGRDYHEVAELANSSMLIKLYRSDGLHLFTTLEDGLQPYWENVENLYKDLNVLKKNHRTYSMKRAVFVDNKIVGIYEVSIVREAWVKGVADRSWLLVALGSMFFLTVYVLMIALLNKKLNRPLTSLMEQMSAFAQGNNEIVSIKHGNDEVGELIKRFMEMKKQVEDSAAQLRQEQQSKEFIVASLSHDLKTPLTVISVYTEALLNNKNLSETEIKEYRTILSEKLIYMKQMLDDLTTYTALQSSQMKMNFVKIDGEEFFEMLFSGFEESCLKKEIHLTVQAENNETYVVDSKQMVRVIDNIVGNAVRHTEQRGNVWLGVFTSHQPLPFWIFPSFIEELEDWRDGGTIIITQNDGDAVPEEMKKSMFEPFVQADQARGKGGSAGLGLSIAKELMEKQNGKIKLWSEQGYGTLVACWLKEGKGNENEKEMVGTHADDNDDSGLLANN